MVAHSHHPRLVGTLICCGSLGFASYGLAQDKNSEEPCIPGHPCGVVVAPAKPRPAAPVMRRRMTQTATTGPVAMASGLRMTPGGGAQIFVQLSQNISPHPLRAAGSLTYVFAGFHVPVHNNRHPLETQYFNTPVSDARLVQDKDSVRFVVLLRTAVDPTQHTVEVEPGKTWELQLDFPAGSYYVAPRERVPARRGRQRDVSDENSSDWTNPTQAPGSRRIPRTHRANSRNQKSAAPVGPPTP